MAAKLIPVSLVRAASSCLGAPLSAVLRREVGRRAAFSSGPRGRSMATMPLGAADRERFDREGFLVVEGALDKKTCQDMMTRVGELISAWQPEHLSVFSTKQEMRQTDEYFLESSDKIHFFLEEKALAADGSFTTDKALCLNKVGHGLHEQDPLFRSVTQRPEIAQAVSALGYISPDLVQSMYIFKQPHIGGEVVTHQDSTFLYTDPPSCLGLWFALEDATLENGCLWAIPGSHKGGISEVFHRNPDYPQGPLCTFRAVGEGATGGDVGELVPLPVKQGDLVMIHGAVHHMSKENTSSKSRHTFQVHLVEDTSGTRVGIDGVPHVWPSDNWLQYPKSKPFPKFESLP
uniref:Fe2OG dioxygenase domain-containing protein n=1 Tax=Hemiselmis andersenii TaxID=464988 RepID=A0A6U2GWQ1_HEMAN